MDKKLKPVPAGNKGLPKLPKEVRNNMGFLKDGGIAKDKQAYQFKLMQKKLSKNKDEMIKFRNQKSKELFKDK